MAAPNELTAPDPYKDAFADLGMAVVQCLPKYFVHSAINIEIPRVLQDPRCQPVIAITELLKTKLKVALDCIIPTSGRNIEPEVQKQYFNAQERFAEKHGASIIFSQNYGHSRSPRERIFSGLATGIEFAFYAGWYEKVLSGKVRASRLYSILAKTPSKNIDKIAISFGLAGNYNYEEGIPRLFTLLDPTNMNGLDMTFLQQLGYKEAMCPAFRGSSVSKGNSAIEFFNFLYKEALPEIYDSLESYDPRAATGYDTATHRTDVAFINPALLKEKINTHSALPLAAKLELVSNLNLTYPDKMLGNMSKYNLI